METDSFVPLVGRLGARGRRCLFACSAPTMAGAKQTIAERIRVRKAHLRQFLLPVIQRSNANRAIMPHQLSREEGVTDRRDRKSLQHVSEPRTLHHDGERKTHTAVSNTHRDRQPLPIAKISIIRSAVGKNTFSRPHHEDPPGRPAMGLGSARGQTPADRVRRTRRRSPLLVEPPAPGTWVATGLSHACQRARAEPGGRW